jgi:hypothetical protein
MDEAAYLDQALYELFLPQLSVEGTWMFLATTQPKDPTNWFATLIEKVSPIYKNFSLERVCKKCQYELDPDQWGTCTHQTIRLGTNKDSGKRKELDGLAIDSAATLREDYNVHIQEVNMAFTKESIERLFSDKQKSFDISRARNILVNFDPSYGGSNNYGTTVSTNIDGDVVILYIDNVNAKKDFMDYILTTLFKISSEIRGNRTEIPIIVAIESNARPDGDNLVYALRLQTDYMYANMHVIVDEMHDHGNGRAGVSLNGYRKDQMIKHTKNLLDRNHIRLWCNLKTMDPKKLEPISKELKDQMVRFKHFEYGESLRISGSKKKRKSGAKQYMKNDDGAVSLAMAAYWGDRILHSNYAPQRRIWGLADVAVAA